MPTPSESASVLQAIGLVAICGLAWLWRRVAREEQARERIATDEMWARDITWYNRNRRPGALRAPRTGGSTT